MRSLVVALTIAGAIAAGAPVRAADNLLLSRFGDYLESLRTQAGIPGLAAAIVGSNDIAWERAFGQQDVDRVVATRTDTPFHLDGLTQTVAAAVVLSCVDEGHVALSDRIDRYAPGNPYGPATIGQILSHTTGGVFSYQRARLDALSPVIESCEGTSFRLTLVNMLENYAMMDSVPGPDSVSLAPSGIRQSTLSRYASVLERLAVPYAVDQRGRASRSQYPATSITPAAGLISTVRDYARFDVALKVGVILRPDTLAMAWTAPAGADGRPLPHGLGWFVQNYNGEKVVWQFGQADNASSSLVVILPARSLTLVLLANSDGLAKSFGLANGDVSTSPFAKLFLGLFVK